MRVKIFIDFWNLQISWNEYHKKMDSSNIKLPWGDKLKQVLLNKLGDNCVYAGTHIYASVNPSNPSDRKLKAFLQNLDMNEGYKVIIKDRKPSKPIYCNQCRNEITACPYCNNVLKRTIEKGVDTTIVIELLQYAIDNIYDKALLVSGDADFIPAIEYIQQKGKQIIHAGWQGKSYNIAKTCWNHIYFDDLMTDLLN